MTKFSSAFASQLSGYALFRVSQGYCESTHSIPLRRFDVYCAECHPLATVLTREIAFGWFEHESHAGFVVSQQKTSALRGFANFINATGGSAYVLPLKMNPPVVRGIPRMPTDKEMSSLFHAVDTTMPRGKYPQGVFSVLFRLVYTCGLRPGEALGLHIADVDRENRNRQVRRHPCAHGRRKRRLGIGRRDRLGRIRESAAKSARQGDWEFQHHVSTSSHQNLVVKM